MVLAQSSSVHISMQVSLYSVLSPFSPSKRLMTEEKLRRKEAKFQEKMKRKEEKAKRLLEQGKEPPSKKEKREQRAKA